MGFWSFFCLLAGLVPYLGIWATYDSTYGGCGGFLELNPPLAVGTLAFYLVTGWTIEPIYVLVVFVIHPAMWLGIWWWGNRVRGSRPKAIVFACMLGLVFIGSEVMLIWTRTW